MGALTNPLTGVSLDFVQADTVIHNLAVPGDLDTGTETITGVWRASTPQGGTVLIDVGRTVLTVQMARHYPKKASIHCPPITNLVIPPPSSRYAMLCNNPVLGHYINR